MANNRTEKQDRDKVGLFGSTYDADTHCEAIRTAKAAGLSDDEAAKVMGASRRTLLNWRERNPEFDEAYREGASMMLDAVESSLYRRALGYDYTEVKETYDHTTDEPTLLERVVNTKHMKADLGSISKVLDNRRPPENDEGKPGWADRRTVEHTGAGGGPIAIARAEVAKTPTADLVDALPDEVYERMVRDAEVAANAGSDSDAT